MILQKSPYLRLTLFYVCIVMTISLLFSVIIYNISTDQINRGLNHQARMLRGSGANFANNTMLAAEIEQIRAEQLYEFSGSLKLNLTYLNLVILLISSGVSYFLAKKTMRPIEESLLAQNLFTADASHELRTPLTAMRTEIEVALRDKNIDLVEAKKLLESNLEEIGKLESLSGALLKIARSQEKIQNHFEIIELSDTLTTAIKKVEKLAQKKEVEIEAKIQKAEIKGDFQNITELFTVLIDNAVKYSSNKSEIKIFMRRDKKNATIEISDQGIGIKNTDLPYIFNRFYRSDTSRSKEKTDGYGLGLAIAKNIVETHSGKITVESKPGEGSVFKITFPLARV